MSISRLHLYQYSFRACFQILSLCRNVTRCAPMFGQLSLNTAVLRSVCTNKKMGCTFQRIPFYDDISNLSDLLQFAVAIFSRAAKFFLDADELVVLRNTVGTAHRTCLNLTRVSSHGNISNRCVLGLS